MSALKRAPFIFEVRDLWPRSIVEVGAMPATHPAIQLLEQLEMFLYSRAARIVTVTDAFVEELAAAALEQPFYSFTSRNAFRLEGENHDERVLRFFEGEAEASDSLRRRLLFACSAAYA